MLYKATLNFTGMKEYGVSFAASMAEDVAPDLINVTGHDDGAGLPCLCKACLPSAGATAEAAGMQFHRATAISGTRVLHFWSVDELKADRARVESTVSEALAARLGRRS